MVDTVAHEVHQRVADLLEDGLVELGLLTRHLQLDLFTQALGKIAHHAREAAEGEADGQHAHPHDAFLQLAHVALELVQPAAKLLGEGAVQLATQLAQHGLGDDQLTHGVDELVDFLDADADGAVLTTALAGLFSDRLRVSPPPGLAAGAGARRWLAPRRAAGR